LLLQLLHVLLGLGRDTRKAQPTQACCRARLNLPPQSHCAVNPACADDEHLSDVCILVAPEHTLAGRFDMLQEKAFVPAAPEEPLHGSWLHHRRACSRLGGLVPSETLEGRRPLAPSSGRLRGAFSGAAFRARIADYNQGRGCAPAGLSEAGPCADVREIDEEQVNASTNLLESLLHLGHEVNEQNVAVERA
jgi:hypothetical protein